MTNQAGPAVDGDKAYRIRFNRTLEPVKVMLVNRKNKLPHTQWLDFVELTRSSIISRPEEYLGRELPSREILSRVVDGIFADFLRVEGESMERKTGY